MENMIIAFEKKLKDITLKEGNVFKREEQSVELCVNTLRELKACVITKGFPPNNRKLIFSRRLNRVLNQN